MATHTSFRLSCKPSEAEVAFLVIDEYQHQGLATRLLKQLLRTGFARGIETFTADTLLTNFGMQALVTHHVEGVKAIRDGTEVLAALGTCCAGKFSCLGNFSVGVRLPMLFHRINPCACGPAGDAYHPCAPPGYPWRRLWQAVSVANQAEHCQGGPAYIPQGVGWVAGCPVGTDIVPIPRIAVHVYYYVYNALSR